MKVIQKLVTNHIYSIPLGVPHRVKQDDWYEGMLIPKDSTVMIPVWALHFSEKHGYDDPDTYNPDRFLPFPRLASELAGIPDYQNRDHYGYGAGRRVCPGMHLAERTQWRITAKILWAFDIVRVIDPTTGKPFPIDNESYNEGLNHCPKPFKVTFKPRSKEHLKVLAAESQKGLAFLKEYE
jgi:cytochrome P450